MLKYIARGAALHECLCLRELNIPLLVQLQTTE